MSETKFTPGPWEVNPKLYTGQDGGKHGYFEIAANRGMFWIARVLGFSAGEDIEQFKANARLIAAAPDMYEALKKLKSEAIGFLEYADQATHGVTNMRVLQHYIDNAITALAKADGHKRSGEDKTMPVLSTAKTGD